MTDWRRALASRCVCWMFPSLTWRLTGRHARFYFLDESARLVVVVRPLAHDPDGTLQLGFLGHRIIALQGTTSTSCRYCYKITTILRAFWLARLPWRDESQYIKHWGVHITSPAFFSRELFINEIHNLFPCNMASSKHLGSWENTRVAFAVASCGFPTLLVFSQLPGRLNEATLHGNALCITKISVLETWGCVARGNASFSNVGDCRCSPSTEATLQ